MGRLWLMVKQALAKLLHLAPSLKRASFGTVFTWFGSRSAGMNTSSPTRFFPYCQHASLSYHTVFAPLVSLIGHRAVLAICFFVRKHYIREEHPQSSRVHEFHGMNRRLIKAIPSLIFTAVLEHNSTSRTCAIYLEDYTVGEKNHMKESIDELEKFDCECIISHMQHRF